MPTPGNTYPLQDGLSQDPAGLDANPYTWDGGATDFAVYDDPEVIHYVSHGTVPPGDLDLGWIQPVFRFELNFKELAASGGVYTTKDRTWRVPELIVPGRELKPADFFHDQSNVLWTVLSTMHDIPSKEWQLTCRNIVLAAQLYDLITIRTATNTADPAGSRVPTLTLTYVNVPARIQELSGNVTDERGARLTGRHYRIYLGLRVVVTQEDEVTDGAGNIYDIVSYANPDRIDELMYLDVERRGWNT